MVISGLLNYHMNINYIGKIIVDVNILNVIWKGGKMTDEELEVFYKLDTKKYLIKYNRTIKEMLKKLEMMMCLDDVQAFIDKLTSWYNIKYSDRYIELILKNDNTMVDTTLVDVMNLQRLQQNFNTLENNIFMDQSKEMVIFRKYLVQMAGCKLIYSQYSSPYLGYYRAQKLFEDFNLFLIGI